MYIYEVYSCVDGLDTVRGFFSSKKKAIKEANKVIDRYIAEGYEFSEWVTDKEKTYFTADTFKGWCARYLDKDRKEWAKIYIEWHSVQ